MTAIINSMRSLLAEAEAFGHAGRVRFIAKRDHSRSVAQKPID
ncbi:MULTISPECIES: hypothetical protein [unclassified Moorena]|nr:MULTISPECIES: hypothetical protein [unclassified Moorena]